MDSDFYRIMNAPMDKKGREEAEENLVSLGLSFVSIGKSILGEDINMFLVGGGKTSVAYFATHHAMESICTNILYMFLYSLTKEGRVRAARLGIDLETLLRHFRFAVVPCVNPDGVELRFGNAEGSPLYQRQIRMNGGADFTSWQANSRGVDLNHNYNFGFQRYKAIEREREIYAGRSLYSGEYPESEPESRAAANLVRTLAPSAVLSLHSQGEEIFSMPDGERRTGRIAERLARLTKYRRSSTEGTAKYGGLCDYTGSLGIPSFTLEVGKGQNPLPESMAQDIFNRLYPALLTLPTML